MARLIWSQTWDDCSADKCLSIRMLLVTRIIFMIITPDICWSTRCWLYIRARRISWAIFILLWSSLIWGYGERVKSWKENDVQVRGLEEKAKTMKKNNKKFAVSTDTIQFSQSPTPRTPDFLFDTSKSFVTRMKRWGSQTPFLRWELKWAVQAVFYPS